MKLRNIDRRTWSRLLMVVSALVMLRLVLQAMLPPAIGSSVPPSAIAKAGLTVPAIVLLFFSAYMLMGITYILLQDRLPGTRTSKGLRFGLAFALMWGAYLLEPVGVSMAAYSDTIRTAVVDTAPIVLLGIALGLLLSRDAGMSRSIGGKRVIFIVAVPTAFLITRLVEYGVLGIYSVFSTMPIISLLWAAGTGVCLAVMYLLIRDALPARSPLKRASLFGIGVFAINLLVFNMFMPAIMEFSVWGIGTLSYADLAVRLILDSAAVIVGISVFERLSSVTVPREVSDGCTTEG